jgi:hypothetical protein
MIKKKRAAWEAALGQIKTRQEKSFGWIKVIQICAGKVVFHCAQA